MESQTAIIVLGGIGFIVLLVLVYYFTRFIFSIKRQLWNQKQTIELLLMLVEKQCGVTDLTSTIRERNNNPNAEIDL